MTENKPRISIVIPCFNAVNTIGHTLDAIVKQDYNKPYEIIVIDSSNDGTADVIDQYPDIKHIRLARQTLPGSGRNLGVKHAKGEIVTFTDSDCVPESDWLEQIDQAFQLHDTEAVGGCVINGYPHSPTAWVSHLIEFNEWTETTPEGYVQNNPSCNLSFKGQVFYDLKIQFTDVFPSEDTLLNWELREKGGRIYFNPNIRIVHLSRVGFLKLFSHQKRLGMASAEARRISTLPGQIFIQFPILCLILPLVRWGRASVRLFRKDLKKMFLFWMLSPLYLSATIAWTVGFMTKKQFKEPEHKIHQGE